MGRCNERVFPMNEYNTAEWLLSGEAASGRAKRAEQYAAGNGEILGAFTHVVWLEIQPNQFRELDASSLDHADRLARHWVHEHGVAMSASIRKVRKDGSLPRKVEAIISPEFNTDWE